MTLDEFLTVNSISNAECAVHIGVTREMVRRYRTGIMTPRAAIKVKIMQYSKGAVSVTLDWRPFV